MNADAPAYGLWSLVIINSAVFLIHLLSNILIAAGFILLSAAWRVLYRAQREGRLATAGPYARIRYPQYAAFVTIMLGFLLQWPTLLTLVMFPVLAAMYAGLARREEREAQMRFGDVYARYAERTPAFFARLGRLTEVAPRSPSPGVFP